MHAGRHCHRTHGGITTYANSTGLALGLGYRATVTVIVEVSVTHWYYKSIYRLYWGKVGVMRLG